MELILSPPIGCGVYVPMHNKLILESEDYGQDNTDAIKFSDFVIKNSLDLWVKTKYGSSGRIHKRGLSREFLVGI